MVLRAFTLSLALVAMSPPAGSAAIEAPASIVASTDDASGDDASGDDSTDEDTTEPTINEFLPEDRNNSDCISALPKPGCGSEARGGWRQGLVLLAILGGLGIIAWRVIASARRTRDATSVPAEHGADLEP